MLHHDIIRDEEADQFIRSRMCYAVAMLTRRGDLPRDATESFLRDCYSELQPQQDCYVWQGWVDAIAWFGLAELKPVVRQAFLRGSINPEWLSFEDFERTCSTRSRIPTPNRFVPTVAKLCSAKPSRNCRGGIVSNRKSRAKHPNGVR